MNEITGLKKSLTYCGLTVKVIHAYYMRDSKKRGVIIVNPKYNTNEGPGCTWFPSVRDALLGIDCLYAAGWKSDGLIQKDFDSDTFYRLYKKRQEDGRWQHRISRTDHKGAAQ